MRATVGLVGDGGFLLPGDVLEKMLNGFSDARCIDIHNANHYSIVLQPFEERD